LFSHPNYVAVVVEGAALPLVHTAWITASVLTVANAVLLRVRIRTENDALGALAASPVSRRASAAQS
jgi:methyltransferase